MNYQWAIKSELNLPTVQERFIEIYYDQDYRLDQMSKYLMACNDFTDQYKLQPPYKSLDSFRVILNKRIRNK